MSGRPSTPPRQPGTLPRSPLTPEQIRRREEQRLRAKALRTQHDSEGSNPQNTPNGFSVGQKRPHNATLSATPTSQRDATTSSVRGGGFTAPKDDSNVKAAKKFDKYIEYDFSKMTDTKGGFLSNEDDPHNRAMHVPNQEEKPAHMTLAEWERHQILKKLRASKTGMFEPGISILNAKERKKCRECGSLEIDWTWDEVFGCRVCNACKESLPDKYSLLTKTEAREDYIITDEELKDEELLPHLKRPNPHKATYHDMQLYLRYQVEDYAFSDKKWGSPEALDAEFERRETEKRKRKEKKFNTKLKELKKRTMVEAHKRKMMGNGQGDVTFGDKIFTEGKHQHEWGAAVDDPESGMSVKTCVECGMEIEELEF